MTEVIDAAGRAQDCDLIMKGGVTSGLVYPGAIAALAQDFRLRNIGGTSAGAIGAVAAAAMEYGLRTGRNPDAHNQMAHLHLELSQTTDQGASRLDAMFCGDAGTRPILSALKDALAGNTAPLMALAGRLIPRDLLIRAAIIMAIFTLAGGWLGWLLAESAEPAVQGLITGLSTILSFVAAAFLSLRASIAPAAAQSRSRLDELVHPIVANGMGLATGLAPTGHSIAGQTVPSLNDWLHGVIQSLAGHAADDPTEVMTFGRLWSLGRDADPSALDARDIDLVLVCSDLNRVQSASFPFLPDNQRLFYDPTEWARIFPAPVLAAMAPHAPAVAGGIMPDDLGYSADDIAAAAADHGDLGTRLRLLPKGKHIPILVGTRASMAFPGLFTPLPLWLLRWVGRPEVPDEHRPVLSRLYLSDGGITSNFPIHLFDAPVPSRPTFAINLLYPDDDLSIEEYREATPAALSGKQMPGNVRTLGGTTAADGAGALADLIMPFTNRDRVAFYKAPASGSAVAQLAGLGLRVVETARTWGDVGLYNQVGMRDRIIHVRLSGHEGGFNLGMDKRTIGSLDSKGVYAGTALACRFRRDDPEDILDDPSRPRFALTWANHRRIRVEGLLGAHDLLAGRFAANWPNVQPMIGDPHLQAIADQIAGIAALPTPSPDPIATALKPLNVLRVRPAEADPRASRRAESLPHKP